MPLCIRPSGLFILLFFAFVFAGCVPESRNDLLLPQGELITVTIQPVSSQVSPCFESGCHAEVKANEGPYKHQPYVDNHCLDCHTTFHNPDTQRLYTQSDIDLCYHCHPQNALGNSHPVGEGVIDPNTDQMMTCTSTCHLSHTAPYEYLLSLQSGGELCLACHKDF